MEAEGGAAVTTYETTAFIAKEGAVSSDLLVVDEAHCIKNPGTQRNKNVKFLCNYAQSILFMTGTAMENRVDEFTSSPAGTILPAQIVSGGTGLNIQAASVVVICEPQFKPSAETQAIGRAYRMGQKRTVLVHRLLCEDTVDERITEMLKKKQADFDAFADESSAARETLELDARSFKTIMEEEAKRIKEKIST